MSGVTGPDLSVMLPRTAPSSAEPEPMKPSGPAASSMARNGAPSWATFSALCEAQKWLGDACGHKGHIREAAEGFDNQSALMWSAGDGKGPTTEHNQ